MGRMKTADCLDRLVEMLQDPAAEVRADAIRALQDLDTPKAIPAIERLLKTEEDDDVRRMAEETLRQR